MTKFATNGTLSRNPFREFELFARRFLIAPLIAAILLAGCQSAPQPDPLVCRYPAEGRDSEGVVPEPMKLALVRLAIGSDSSSATTNPTTNLHQIIWNDVLLETGKGVGFRTDGNQLIAYAGPTTMPLAPGVYEWVSVPTKAPDQQVQHRDPVVDFWLNMTIIWPTALAILGAIGLLRGLGGASPP